MNAVIEVGFDYSVIDADGRDDVKEAAVRIRLRMSRTVEDIIEIGRDLIAVKKTVGHGHFLRWIETEFGMTDQTARNFMRVCERFGDKFKTVLNLDATVLYALAARSTDDAVVEEVVERAAAGEPVTTDDVKALKAEWASERKDLKRQIEDQKFKVRDAHATQQDFSAQLQELQADLAAMRDERETLRHELETARRGVVGNTRIVNPVGDFEAIEKQVSVLLSAWNKAGSEARQIFLERIDTPVFDRGAA